MVPLCLSEHIKFTLYKFSCSLFPYPPMDFLFPFCLSLNATDAHLCFSCSLAFILYL